MESFDTIFNIGFGGRTTPPLPLLWVGKIAHGERVKNEVILHRFQAVIFKCFLILILMIRIKHPKKLNPINNEKYGSVPYKKNGPDPNSKMRIRILLLKIITDPYSVY